MLRTVLSVAALVTVLTLSAGCDADSTASTTSEGASVSSTAKSPEYSLDMLEGALEAAGLSVSRIAGAPKEIFFGGSTRTELRASDASVQAHVFATPEEAAAAASAVTADGSGVPTGEGGVALVEWVGTPHFFARDRIIVLYLSPRLDSHAVDAATDQLVLKTLQSEMGSQFAGL
jgi:hypothetical protein